VLYPLATGKVFRAFVGVIALVPLIVRVSAIALKYIAGVLPLRVKQKLTQVFSGKLVFEFVLFLKKFTAAPFVIITVGLFGLSPLDITSPYQPLEAKSALFFAQKNELCVNVAVFITHIEKVILLGFNSGEVPQVT